MHRFFRFSSIIVLVLLAGMLGARPALAVRAAPAVGVVVPTGSPIEIAVALCNGWPTFQDHLDAVDMAIIDYGLIKGFAVQRNDYLGLCDTPSGETSANTIVVNGQNVGVIGPIFSASTLGALPVFEVASVVMISHANTRLDLPQFGPNSFNRTVVAGDAGDPWVERMNSQKPVRDWRDDFAAMYGRAPDAFSVLAYDAALVLLASIDEISMLEMDGSLVIDRGLLLTAVRTTVNFEGASGPVTLAYNGDRVDYFTRTTWDDQFDEVTLNPMWSWIDEDATHWSLTEIPGFLQIVSQQLLRNQLVQPIPTAPFEIRTRVLFTPTEDFQFAGLTIYGDNDNRLNFGRAFCDNLPPSCVNNGIYFDRYEGGTFVGSNYGMNTEGTDEAYLRIVTTDGINYTAFVSENGTQWTEVGTHTIGFIPTQIGLIVGNGTAMASELPADFDFFVVEYPAKTVYLPAVTK